MRAARVVFLVVATAVVYANSLDSPLVIDDEVTIVENEQIRALWSPDVFLPERELPVAGRPLANLTFAANYAVSGTAPRGYRLTNLLIHTACGLMLLALARRVLGVPSMPNAVRAQATHMATAIAAIWLLHPLTSEVVNYLTQRTEGLMAFFYLLTLYASIRALGAASRRWELVAMTTCLAGTLCKESMATAPVALMLFDRVFVFRSLADGWRARRRLYVGLMASWVVLAGILATGPRAYSTGFATSVSVWTYLLNQTEMITRYLSLTVWPRSLVVYYGFPRALTLGDVLPQAVVVVALLGLTLALFSRWPKLAFAGAWVFITLSPSSSIVPIATEVGAERRMYLPLMALVTLAVLALWTGVRRAQVRVAVVGMVLVLLGTATVARNAEYSSSLRLAELDAERWPSGTAHHLLAQRLMQAGRADEAVAHLREAVAYGEARAHNTLGLLLLNRNDLDGAIVELSAFIEKLPMLLEVPTAHVGLAQAYARQARWDEALRHAQEAVEKAPGDADARRVHAAVLFSLERVEEATTAYLTYLRLRPNDAQGLHQLGLLLAAQGRLSEAIPVFERAATVAPSAFQWQFSLATALLDAGRVDEAVRVASRAVTLRPGDPAGQSLLAEARARQAARR